MDHSWRPPPLPPIPGNTTTICPVCSISHFPFCPPPPFIENPRFHYSQPPYDYHHQPPRFDHPPPPPPSPFPNHPTSLNYNYDYNHSDGYVGRRPTWYGSNPSLDMSSYDGIADPPNNGNYNSYHRGGVGSAGYGYDNGGIKRMKIEPTDNNRGPIGSFMGGENVDTSRSSSDNERILKLIHDHGNAANSTPAGLPKAEADLLSEPYCENANRYAHEGFEEICEVRDEMGLKRRQMSDFPGMGMGSFARKESSLRAGPGSDLRGSGREEGGAVYGKNNVVYDHRDELGQSQYDRLESSLPQSLDYSRHSSQPARLFSSKEQSEPTQDHHRGVAPYHSVLQRSELSKKLPLPQDIHDPTTETLHENYHHLQRTTLSNSAMRKNLNPSHPGQSQLPLPAETMQHYMQPNHNILSSRIPRDVNRPVDVNDLSQEGIPSSIRHHNSQPPYTWLESKGHYAPNSLANFGPGEVPHAYHGQPPLPGSPPPPPPIDPPRNHFFETIASPPAKKPSLFPISTSSSADSSASRHAISENQSSAQVYYTNNVGHHASPLSSAEEFHARQPSSEKHVRDVQPFPLRHLPLQKPHIIDASHIFKQPHRASRPDHLVVILRGLPGSGKSYLAKLLRDIEVDNGGEAPRIHSMDEYFMTEVEKAEDSELSKSSGSIRGKRQVMKKVMEYCYEPEMEEAYRASMLKAFKKTLDEGIYSFIIVDDRNLRVADFAQFWATAKRSGYEVYIVEAAYKDPAGCAARNVHNFTLDDIQKMAGQWEEAPPLYLKMDIKSLLHGDGFDDSGIQEVDMDMEDEEVSEGPDVKTPEDNGKDQVDDFTPHDVGPVKDVKTEEVNHLSRSKWSNDLDGSESLEAEGGKKNGSALSGLIQAYSKEGKSVRWGDQGGNAGFSISATRKTNIQSLVIGPGSGYNLKSNPLSEEEYVKPARNAAEPKSQNVFQERIRAERESFKAVFDKRRQRISGFNFNVDEE